MIPLKDLVSEEPKLFTLDLLKNMNPKDAQNEKSRGQIIMELTYKPFRAEDLAKSFKQAHSIKDPPEGTPPGGGLLVVIIHEAQDVEGKYHTNPHVRLIFKGEERRTKVIVSIESLYFYVFIFLLHKSLKYNVRDFTSTKDDDISLYITSGCKSHLMNRFYGIELDLKSTS